MSHDDKMFDVRLVKHHIRRQVLDPKDFQKHLDGLEDDAAHGEETETRFSSSPAVAEEPQPEA